MNQPPTPLFIRMFRALLFGRLEPVETILCFSAILHGMWLVFPEWGVRAMDNSIGSTGRVFEILVGAFLAAIGAAQLGAMYGKLARKIRINLALIKFILWSFLTWITLGAEGVENIVWVGYLTISLVSASVYLNISLKNGDK